MVPRIDGQCPSPARSRDLRKRVNEHIGMEADGVGTPGWLVALDVEHERAAQGDIHKLEAAADAQHRDV